MDWLKSLPLSLVAGATGCVLVVAGLAGTLKIWTLDVSITDDIYRIAAIILGTIFVISAIFHEVRQKIKTTSVVPDDNSGPRIYSLDDPGIPSLSERLTGARTVTFFTRSGVSLFNQYAEFFSKLAREGTEFRLLMTDPDSTVSRTIYGGDDYSLAEYTKSTLDNIDRQQNLEIGRNLSIRFTKYAPTFGAMLVEHLDKSKDYVQISVLFTHTLYGRDRPNFVLKRGDRWFEKFGKEIETSWNSAKEFTNHSDATETKDKDV